MSGRQHYERALAHAAAGHRLRALQHLNEAVARSPELREEARAEASFARWARDPGFLRLLDRDEDVDAVLLSIEDGDFVEAVEHLRHLLAERESDVALRYYYGICLHQLGEFEGALAAADRCLELLPDFVEAHFNRAIALEQLGRVDEAVAAYETALSLEPDHESAAFNLGLLHKHAGRIDAAIATFSRSIEAIPEDPLMRYRRAELLAIAGRRDDAFEDLLVAASGDIQALIEAMRSESLSEIAASPEMKRRLDEVRRAQL